MKSLRIPHNVEVVCTHVSSQTHMRVSGLYGSSTLSLTNYDPKGMCILKTTDAHIHIAARSSHPKAQALVSTLTSLLRQRIDGVARGYLLYLDLVGVGFRAEMLDASTLDVKVGKSHAIHVQIPKDIRAVCVKPTRICMYGVDVQSVSHFAADIKRLCPIEPYKGKGIRFVDEHVLQKEGKKK